MPISAPGYTDWFNKVIDDTEHRNVAKVQNEVKDQTMFRLSDQERAKWEARIQPVIDNWVKNTPDGGNSCA